MLNVKIDLNDCQIFINAIAFISEYQLNHELFQELTEYIHDYFQGIDYRVENENYKPFFTLSNQISEDLNSEFFLNKICEVEGKLQEIYKNNEN